MHRDIDLLLALDLDLDLALEAHIEGPVDIGHQAALVHAPVHVGILALVLVLCQQHHHNHLDSEGDDIGPQLPLAQDLAHDLAHDRPAPVRGDIILLPVVSPILGLVRGFRSLFVNKKYYS